jgi:hypothetical protein
MLQAFRHAGLDPESVCQAASSETPPGIESGEIVGPRGPSAYVLAYSEIHRLKMVRKVYFPFLPTVLAPHSLEVSEKAAPASHADSNLQDLSLPEEDDLV